MNYTNDKTGRVTSVAGTPWAENPTGNYANNIEYRAFGQVKRMNYTVPNDNIQINLQYDNRLRVSHSEVTSETITGDYLMKADYSYFADSRVSAKDDLLDNKWDRTMKYDFAGRLSFNQFGIGTSWNNQQKRVYEQTISYDAFSQMTVRQGEHWGNNIYFSSNYVNGRLQQSDLSYDASGNVFHKGTNTDPHTYQDTTFDASGRRTVFFDKIKGRFGNLLNMIAEYKTEQLFDGDGRPVVEKEGRRNYHVSEPPSTTLETMIKTYQVWSSVLGSSLTEILPNGEKYETKIFAGNALIARQSENGVEWTTADPVTGTVGKFGYVLTTGVAYKEETEPLGQRVNSDDPQEQPDPIFETRFGSADDPEWQCQVQKYLNGGFQGMPWSCKFATKDIQSFTPNEENPNHAPNESPNQKRHPTQSSLVNLTATEKTPAEMNLNRTVSQASVASSEGKNSEECDFDADGKPTCTVEVNAPLLEIDFEDTGIVSAELGSLQDFAPVPTDLRDKVVERLDKDNKKCRNFLDKVRKNLNIEETFEELFDEVIDDKGNFVLDNSLLGTGTAGISHMDGNERNVGLRPSINAATYINVVLHELIHRAGIGSHVDFAEAGYNALTVDEQKANQLPNKKDVKAINKAIDEENKKAKKADKKAKKKPHTDLGNESSTYFSKLMNKYCGQ